MKTYKYSKLKEIRNATTKDEYKQTGNIFSRITIERAKDGSLDENSLGEVLDMKSTEEVTDKLQDEWKIEADRASTTGNSLRLWKAVCKLVETGVIVRSLFFGILDSGDYGLWIDREVQVRDLNWVCVVCSRKYTPQCLSRPPLCKGQLILVSVEERVDCIKNCHWLTIYLK